MFRITTRTVRIGTAVGAAAAALLLAGCSDDSSMPGMDHGSSAPSMPAGMDHGSSTPGAAQRTDFNDADVTFLNGMYPHHAQAVDMAKLIPSRSQHPKVRELGVEIEAAQAPEMEQIAGLLKSFGKPAPSAGSDHGGHGGGMMTADQMKALAAVSGPEFDRMFLTLMIEHHRGAIEMANTEIANGVNAESKKLAQAIVGAQQIEIDEMNALLAAL